MKIVLATAVTIFVVGTCGLIAKFWGKSQHYVEYRHAFLAAPAEQQPLMFVKPAPEKLTDFLSGGANLLLDAAITSDQILVFAKEKSDKPIRLQSVGELGEKVITLEQAAPFLKDSGRRFILNLTENTRAEHEVFVENLRKVGLEKAGNFLVMSDYEAPLRALKELAPSMLYGSSKPEILRIVAMQSMYLLEAVTLRADVIVHPFMIRNQKFFNEELVSEMGRRYIKIIVGPVSASEMAEVRQLKPFGIIVSE